MVRLGRAEQVSSKKASEVTSCAVLEDYCMSLVSESVVKGKALVHHPTGDRMVDDSDKEGLPCKSIDISWPFVDRLPLSFACQRESHRT